MNEYETLKE